MPETHTIRFPVVTVRGALCVERRTFEAGLGSEGSLKYVAEITGPSDKFRYERRFLRRTEERRAEGEHFIVTALRPTAVIEIGAGDKSKIYFMVLKVEHDHLLLRRLSSFEIDGVITSKHSKEAPPKRLTSDGVPLPWGKGEIEAIFSETKDDVAKKDLEDALDAPEPPDHPALDEGVDSTKIASADTVESFRDLFKGGS